MNITKEKKEVIKWANEWIKTLKLTQWNFSFSWEKEHKEDIAAWVQRDNDYLRAYVYVHEKTFFETYKDLGKEKAYSYLLHEIVHILLNDYDTMVRARFTTEPECTTVRERTTEQLTNILLSLHGVPKKVHKKSRTHKKKKKA